MKKSELTKLRRLAGINEAQYLTRDEADEMDLVSLNDQEQRERTVLGFIVAAFVKIGLKIDIDSSYYDEDEGRIAHIVLEDDNVDLMTLSKLNQTGLSDHFVVHSREFQLEIEFIVTNGLETASISI